MALNPDEHRLSETEHQAIFEKRIKPTLFLDVLPSSSERPIAIIFGGQPGAGKSSALATAKSELESKGGAIEIIGDDLRPYHPEYAVLASKDDKTAAFYTDRDSGRWVEKAIEAAKSEQVNLVIEGTMRNLDVVAKTMSSLREAGFEIDARAMAVSPLFSEQGILLRYEQQKAERGTGRMTTPEAHLAGLNGMLDTLEGIEREKLADKVTILRRSGEVIYKNELQNGNWIDSMGARAAVEQERARPFTVEESKQYAAGYERLMTMISAPGRQATDEEKNKALSLYQSAAELLSKSLVADTGDKELADVEGLEREQQATVETTEAVDQTYQQSLENYVSAKEEQAGRLEDKIESLIEQQQAKLQQTQSTRPGIISLPGAKKSWQAQQAQQQARLNNLIDRLEAVREIKDGMGLHSPRIEELASRKLRFEQPGLAADWDEHSANLRREKLLKQQEERKQEQTRSQGVKLGLSRKI
ncbi:hypothetical protein KAM329D_32200 [Aeromonas caviae]|uniref:zeta toxin family protein n=3 Tax=Aeromonas caviae TaxID=648 RepID=UPI0018A4D5A7|nr:zeta toxin family protein [Aeromonas caviae]BCM78163.1 hypothetical protein KAM329_47150 [Aeromonas caviae]GJA15515.1 hypothetical protein KAM335_27110 [Aeromonas caviae]GJC24239.1 hypothetical protein KAM329D_32200 [Aeromonas caviae]